ncbi:MAG: homocysteine S-methyltransferase family protein [Candidatus Goldbacteria bacterium]|nr:homocysteine S-methyltransferase family protein [Candidatus Goldiibacteriota bacterium]
MDRKKFIKLIKNEKVILLDGSSGVALQKAGMPKGVCPEKWAIDNSHHLIKLQQDYINAGSKIIYTFTFGANRIKLSEFNLEKEVITINKKLVKISKSIAGNKILIAGDIGPTGKFPQPTGDMDFNECVEIFKEQAKGLLAGGVDLFVIETMIDIQEARAALIACKELCNLPVIVSMTFDKNKRTLTGTTPEAAIITLQALGADVIGVNCSTGPKEMIEVVKAMKPYAKVPLIAKPNAGLPRLLNNQTVFDMSAREFALYTKDLIKAGANLIGGCCGTTPEYISLMKKNIIKPKLKLKKEIPSALSSYQKIIEIGKEFILVGERINPTGKKNLQEELKKGVTNEIRNLAFEQVERGASILDVNVGMPGIDEKETMKKVINLLSTAVDIPICVDSSSPEVIEQALRIYPGRVLINSISGESKKLKKLLPIASKYGAMFILLPLDDRGVPETALNRQKIIKKVIKLAKKFGFAKNDIIIDGLVMTVSSKPDAPKETLKLIKWAKKNGFNSIIGLSNVSFGLPQRHIINSTFLNMAKKAGLNFVIANPSYDFNIINKDAINLLLGKDKNCKKWIERYTITAEDKKIHTKSTKSKTIYDAVLNGEKEIIGELINSTLIKGVKPQNIVDDMLIPAINHVGELYDKKIYFLPQLIASADTMKKAFSILEPLLLKSNIKKQENNIVLATVKGDIHDIGKNIVALMLKNYGYNVYDLGKDVDSKIIISKARQLNAKIIGLSALMTTTMVEMKTVIELAKKEKLQSKIIIGGAVITESFANEIGADGYAKDAYEAVKLVDKILNNKR